MDDSPESCLHFSVLSEANEEEALQVEIDLDSPAALPKGGDIDAPAQQVDGENPNLYLTPEDVTMVLLCMLRSGVKVLLMKKFDIGPFLELIERQRVTVAAMVPPLTKNSMVGMFNLNSTTVVLSGVVPLGKELMEALQARLPQADLDDLLRSLSSLLLHLIVKIRKKKI